MRDGSTIGVIAAIDKLAKRCARRFEVRRVILFGSRARGDFDDRSDIDIAVEAPSADVRQWDELSEILDESETLLEIDLVRLERAPEALRERIEREGRVLFERRD